MADELPSHDGVFRRTFSVPEHALDLMRRQLPEELVDALDPGSLREESGTYVDDTLKEARSDVLFSATLRGEPVLLYVLIEHQSTQDPLMPYRLLRYVVRIWEKWLEHERARAGSVPTTLPPVIPFVLHQGPDEWAVARTLEKVVPLPEALEPFVRPLLPGLDMSVLDLGGRAPSAIKDWDATPAVKLTLAFMRAVVEPGVDLLALLEAFAAELVALMARPGGPDVFRVVMRYSVRRRPGLNVKALAARVATLAGGEAGEIVKSTADELIEQGERQGEQKGELKHARQMLLRQLRLKFGAPSVELEQRIAAAPLPELIRWTESFVSAQRIEDVFRSE